MSEASNDLVAATTAAARTWHGTDDGELLQSIVDVAGTSVPGFEHASLNILGPGSREVVLAANTDLARELDALQDKLDEGPCTLALEKVGLVAAPRLRHEQRWPAYVAEALQRGVRAQISIKVHLDEDRRTLGGLNMYSTTTDEVSDEAAAMVELFATQAAVALGSARQRYDLNRAVTTRQLVGQAIGLVMERYTLDEHHAFRYLVRTSTTTNTKLHQVAQDLLDEANRRQA